MKPPFHKRSARNAESGYAMVLIMFFLALLVLSTVVAAPTVLSSIQREREEEMVWRGKQYARGVRLYYLKMHRFPSSLDDLTKPKTGIRFMRKAYKDPMNQVDGSWRLIYVGPNGQLIGSLKQRSISLAVPSAAQSASNTPSSTSSLLPTSSSFGTSSSFSSSMQPISAGLNTSQNAGSVQGGAVGAVMQNPSSLSAAAPENPDSLEEQGQPQSLAGAMDSTNTIGGNIIGVGSKVNKRSFMWYEKAKNYRQFEFIWDPSKDTTGSASVGIGTPVQNLGASPNPGGTSNSLVSPGTKPGPVSPQNQNFPGVTDQTPPLQAPPPNQ